MKLPIFQVDAFTENLFGGNPAAVMPLEAWLPDATLQAIAAENNLSETAFLVGGNGAYALRWFTPTVEVDLCGHATLAAAHTLYEHLGERSDDLVFETRSGALTVRRQDTLLEMDFPAAALEPRDCPHVVSEALGTVPDAAFMTDTASPTWLLVYDSEETIAGMEPDFPALAAATERCVIVTAPAAQGDNQPADFVSRFFGPAVGINEDPVTGSAHCALVPYWAGQLGQSQLNARQISRRGGHLECSQQEDRVILRGTARSYMQGTVWLD